MLGNYRFDILVVSPAVFSSTDSLPSFNSVRNEYDKMRKQITVKSDWMAPLRRSGRGYWGCNITRLHTAPAAAVRPSALAVYITD
jgi:hypothetical protein